MIRTCLILFYVCFSTLMHAQSLSGIVNQYTAVTALDTCLGRLLVSDTSGFKKGDAILLIQMQGASIATANNSTYGNIQALHSAGRYERAVLDSVGAGSFFVQNQLVNQFSPGGKIQAVRIAAYQSVTLTDTVFARPWNGQTGGIVVLEVSDTLVMNAPIIADGAGFRGGTASVAPGNNCNFLIPETGYYYGAGNWRGSNKGEGIAVSELGKELGRGPQGTGGGGGNDHNAGGGGGAQAGRGGSGGNNDEPSAFGCDGYYPGIGAYQVADETLRLFAGGGGGAGHANNGLVGSGGRGGGIVVILAGAITGNQPVISANGTTAATVEGDGGGGGGSGGTIYLQTNSAPQNLQLRANGGGGGNTSNNNSNRCFGPGGGGGGGRILADLPGIAIPAGGNAGIVTNSTNGCLGSTNGAEAGQNGRIDSILGIPKGALPLRPEITMEAQSDTVCAGKPAFFSIHTNAGNWNLQWQFNSGAAWQNIAAGMGFAGFQEDTLLINNVSESMDGWLFRVNIQRPGCFELNSQPAELRVAKLPMANFSVQMQADLAVFTNLSVGADAYLWSFGDGQFSEETDPQHAYPSEGMYTVALTVFNSCDTVVFTEDINVLLLPNAAFSAPDSAVACGPATVMFENLSSENSGSFQWFFPGGTPESTSEMNPEVVYDLSGVYFATLVVANNAGFDTATHLIYVQVLDFPNAHFTYSILPGGVVDFVNTSMPEAGFSWDVGDGSPAVSADSILTHQYLESGTYTISLVASNACGASVFQEMIQINLESVGLADMQSDTPIRVYPNPAGQYLIVDCMRINRAPDNIRLLDVSGRPVLEKYGMTGLTTVVSLEEIPAGAYLLEVRAGTSVKRQIVIRSEK